VWRSSGYLWLPLDVLSADGFLAFNAVLSPNRQITPGAHLYESIVIE
jgi:hypothetical protein